MYPYKNLEKPKKFNPITAIQQRTNLLFEHEDTTSDIADTEAQVKTILEELVTSQASKRPDIFIKLVHAMRHLKFTSLSNLFWQIGDFNIPGHEETLRKVYASFGFDIVQHCMFRIEQVVKRQIFHQIEFSL